MVNVEVLIVSLFFAKRTEQVSRGSTPVCGERHAAINGSVMVRIGVLWHWSCYHHLG